MFKSLLPFYVNNNNLKVGFILIFLSLLYFLIQIIDLINNKNLINKFIDENNKIIANSKYKYSFVSLFCYILPFLWITLSIFKSDNMITFNMNRNFYVYYSRTMTNLNTDIYKKFLILLIPSLSFFLLIINSIVNLLNYNKDKLIINEKSKIHENFIIFEIILSFIITLIVFSWFFFTYKSQNKYVKYLNKNKKFDQFKLKEDIKLIRKKKFEKYVGNKLTNEEFDMTKNILERKVNVEKKEDFSNIDVKKYVKKNLMVPEILEGQSLPGDFKSNYLDVIENIEDVVIIEEKVLEDEEKKKLLDEIKSLRNSIEQAQENKKLAKEAEVKRKLLEQKEEEARLAEKKREKEKRKILEDLRKAEVKRRKIEKDRQKLERAAEAERKKLETEQKAKILTEKAAEAKKLAAEAKESEKQEAELEAKRIADELVEAKKIADEAAAESEKRKVKAEEDAERRRIKQAEESEKRKVKREAEEVERLRKEAAETERKKLETEQKELTEKASNTKNLEAERKKLDDEAKKLADEAKKLDDEDEDADEDTDEDVGEDADEEDQIQLEEFEKIIIEFDYEVTKKNDIIDIGAFFYKDGDEDEVDTILKKQSLGWSMGEEKNGKRILKLYSDQYASYDCGQTSKTKTKAILEFNIVKSNHNVPYKQIFKNKKNYFVIYANWSGKNLPQEGDILKLNIKITTIKKTGEKKKELFSDLVNLKEEKEINEWGNNKIIVIGYFILDNTKGDSDYKFKHGIKTGNTIAPILSYQEIKDERVTKEVLANIITDFATDFAN